ncbi:28S ribosomal protein S30, mitochondrial [Athalia rosae]|uniref:28S ribosomal protein S30, mitochondrial n=1 Tax=Athalia rosae TaxID=37344 RepID=UPI0020346D8F|nr:28S ribosomal protein S30, mitochondrial [Athalia rosae]
MSLMRVNPRSYVRLSTIFREGKRLHSVVAKEVEYSDPPQYPPILDLSLKAKEKRRHESWHEEIKKLNTVEEKLMKINMPRYYGWKSLMLFEHLIPYNSESLAQFITRTHLIQEPGLPKYYDRVMAPEKIEEIVQRIKKQIEETILLEYNYRKREQEIEAVDEKKSELLNNARTEALVRQINRILLATLASDLPHLLEAQIDDEPRVEAFWFAGGIEPPKAVRKFKESVPWLKDYANDPLSTKIQYKGEPILQLRHDLPLKEIVSLSESENPVFTVPEFRFDPRVLGYEFKYVHGTNIPGFWPGDPSEFGLMSYHNRNHLDKRSVKFKDDEDALNVQAIYASYSWLLSQACYQGFSTFTDLTYPLLTQTVITNGQSWSLYAYQLNTTLVNSEHADTNPRKNLCWTSGSMKLFEGIEDGKLVGLNDDVLKTLIKFYANVPQKREGVNMKPYLGTSEQKIADITDPERRAWLEKYFKHMYSNRPRHFLREEIDHWEKIYKIDFKTRFMDKKLTKWEHGYRHSARKYDDHLPTYIPKCLRPGGPKSRNKWAKTYYP